MSRGDRPQKPRTPQVKPAAKTTSKPVAKRPASSTGGKAARRPAGEVATKRRKVEVKARNDQITQRQREKRRAARRANMVRALKVLAVALLVGAVVWVVGFSPVLALRTEAIDVTVQSGHVETEMVRDKVESRAGVPLVRISTGDLERNILEDTAIQSATVKRKWPSGLLVEVSERAPVLAVQSPDEFRLVGADGVTIGVQNDTPEGLLVVEASGGDLAPSQLERILETWANLPENISEQVRQMSSVGTTLTFHLAGGETVLWGDDENEPLKAEVLTLLLEQRDASHYDVSNPVKPSTK